MKSFCERGYIKNVNGYYAIVINTKVNGVRKLPQWNTGIPIKGNKARANELLEQALEVFEQPNSIDEYNAMREKIQGFLYNKISRIPNLQRKLAPNFAKKMENYIQNHSKSKSNQEDETLLNQPHISIYRGPQQDSVLITENTLFADYLDNWMQYVHSQNCSQTTWGKGYSILCGRDIPYFKEIKVCLKDVTAKLLNYYYQAMASGMYIGTKYYKPIKPNTIYQHHWLICAALGYAAEQELIPFNPAKNIKLPKQSDRETKDVYSLKELQKMFELIEGNPCEFPVLMAAYYGLRRSEILGLQWKDINFEKKYIQIRRTVHYTEINGHFQVYVSENTKTRTSTRTLPLIKPIENMLYRIQLEIQQNRKKYSDSYTFTYKDFVFVDRHGKLRSPETVSKNFKQFLIKNNLHYISLHNLRHTVGTLLCEENENLEKIKEWLGHSSVEITSKYYLHVNYKSKVDTAKIIEDIMPMCNTTQQLTTDEQNRILKHS